MSEIKHFYFLLFLFFIIGYLIKVKYFATWKIVKLFSWFIEYPWV